MNEVEELPGAGDQVRISRGTALKIGGLGLATAIAGFLPGRASSSVRRRSVTNTCSSVSSTTCGQGPVTCNFNSGCSCITVFHKVQKVGAFTTACAQGVAGSFACNNLVACPQGTECGPASFCARSQSTCCSKPVCVPECRCTSAGNCNTGFNGCGTGVPCDGLGSDCFCFTAAEGGPACGQNVFCSDVPTCSVTSDCPNGFFCGISNGCTGCSAASGVCIPYCGTCNVGTSRPFSRSGQTAVGILH